MTVTAVSILGLASVLLALQLKGVKGEYSVYLVLASGVVIFFYGISKLETIVEAVKQVQAYIQINNVYISTLMKMVGITYIAEFSSGICKDAGYGALGGQIEMFGKLSVLAVSIPIFLALLEIVQEFLG